MSGGLDSLVALGYSKKHTDYNIELALTFDYGQKTVIAEIEHSKKICDYYNIEHKIIKPYACPHNVAKFKLLQKLHSIGFVEPVNEEHMYFAAMKSKQCRLTEVGKYYWRLVKSGRI